MLAGLRRDIDAGTIEGGSWQVIDHPHLMTLG